MTQAYPFEILHHGGAKGVTGSCHELRIAKDAGILIDCGLFQGAEESEGGAGESRLEIDFPIDHIKALVVTHVHIDHVGRIPYLLAAGFKGPIYCSEPSALLLPLVLEDAFKIGFTRDRRLVEKFLDQIRQLIVPVPYRKWQRVYDGPNSHLTIKLQPAGHILGSAYVECKVRHLSLVNSPLLKTGEFLTLIQNSKLKTQNSTEHRVVFSGDLGAPFSPLLCAPRSPYRADMLVLESTYGDKEHEGRRERREKLKKVIERALENRGVLLIPAFSIGRTQELLYELEELIHRNRERFAARGLPWEDLEIIVDSPLASRFTKVYRKLQPYWDKEARHKLKSGRHPLSFEQLTTVDTHQDHQNTVAYLKKTARPCIVIAASGMCAGGRIVNYLKALIGDERTDILFVGYQARGTPGRAIQQYGPKGGYVFLGGRKYDIKAGVYTIGGYSAHADRQNLVNFVKRMRYTPRLISLVHGDEEAKQALRLQLIAELAEPQLEVKV